MTNFKAANLTKYVAGGTGDNIIQDGYIKAVEKIWLDSFTYTAVVTTADTIAIASIPKNKKITGVEIYLPVTFAPTNTTINVGISSSTALFVTSSTTYVVGNAAATGSTVMVNNKVTMNNPAGFQFITTLDQNLIYLSLGVTAMTLPTAGTITSIVRYT